MKINFEKGNIVISRKTKFDTIRCITVIRGQAHHNITIFSTEGHKTSFNTKNVYFGEGVVFQEGMHNPGSGKPYLYFNGPLIDGVPHNRKYINFYPEGIK